MKTAAITVLNLTLSLDNHLILDNISTQFYSGELTILLGPNGAGKSSLLKMVAQEYPNNGSVHIFDTSLNEWNRSELARHLGVLPQTNSLTFNFTVREVVELGGLALESSKKETTEIATQAMKDTDVFHLAQREYPHLSGGEKQRVHLARVLTQLAQSKQQKILLLDEPTSSLDLSHQHQTLQLAKALTQKGAAVITVIHDLNLAAKYADRILILHQGKLVADGTPWETLTQENMANIYQWPVEVIAHPTDGYPVILG